jgi:hypothetical protein
MIAEQDFNLEDHQPADIKKYIEDSSTKLLSQIKGN